MTETTPRLRVAVGVDLKESLCELVERLEPRVELVRDHTLYHPMRGPADWSGDPAFTRTAEQQRAFDELVDSADALFGIPDVDPAALTRTVRANPRLRWVHATAAGGGGQVKAASLTNEELERVAFTTSAGVHGETLAEFALFGVLAGAKDLPRLQAQQSRREWSDRWEMRQLDEMTVLVVGLGGIGAAAARKFHALGATVLGTTRSGEPVEGVDRLVPIEELDAAAAEADAVVVTLPGTTATEGLLGESFFANVKPGAIVSNVGRGTVIDEDALLAALRDGRVSFAALDVFAVEPLPADSPLWSEPNVLVSPHTAALNSAEEIRIARLFAENARHLLDGEPLKNRVDTVEFY
ncbi:D-2-hydroxyacid dehydrogenase [Pseudoclavibacter chungangensis]|uniref:D-2-hydroxyacid dehydrogenase n=1 Tax=Pseudoclavibacter chungangensis TaxID=587635 RepID=A0A7J5BWQ1_9MICO|nr:D-2-hydroxyacid dehydrogenase [Pseudoclavibacter chungangensis]KAB1657920.1 D-2-hydroxyacid dehydrogenase [Pseudoclavibacter chungangensis]NYJ65933.1 phosphoglycerate dehydrogenase-like enzyme [Pseudoclavibacter chungangensis]